MKEFDWIKRIQAIEKNKNHHLLPGIYAKQKTLGIGDDCALVEDNQQRLIFTNDSQWQGVHFLTQWSTPFQVGWKGVSAAFSDLACKGVWGGYMLVTCAFPNGIDPSIADDIWRGISQAATLYQLTILGGNTISSCNVDQSPGPIMLDFALTAMEIRQETDNGLPRWPLRRMAMDQDLIFTNPGLGKARAGLLRLRKNGATPDNLLKAKYFLEPTLDCQMSSFLYALRKENLIHAAMDISDGIIGDLGHILQSSDKNATLFENSISLAPEVLAVAEMTQQNPLEIALSGGEDYQALFTVPKSKQNAVMDLATHYNVAIEAIGEIIPGPYDPARKLVHSGVAPDSFIHLT